MSTTAEQKPAGNDHGMHRSMNEQRTREHPPNDDSSLGKRGEQSSQPSSGGKQPIKEEQEILSHGTKFNSQIPPLQNSTRSAEGGRPGPGEFGGRPGGVNPDAPRSGSPKRKGGRGWSPRIAAAAARQTVPYAPPPESREYDRPPPVLREPRPPSPMYAYDRMPSGGPTRPPPAAYARPPPISAPMSGPMSGPYVAASPPFDGRYGPPTAVYRPPPGSMGPSREIRPPPRMEEPMRVDSRGREFQDVDDWLVLTGYHDVAYRMEMLDWFRTSEHQSTQAHRPQMPLPIDDRYDEPPMPPRRMYERDPYDNRYGGELEHRDKRMRVIDDMPPRSEYRRLPADPGFQRPPMLRRRYFLIKSWNHENVEDAKLNSTWATQEKNIEMFEAAFADREVEIILIFSVNKSAKFQGYARMESPIGAATPPKWTESLLWPTSGAFRIKWLCHQPLDFYRAAHLRNSFNENQPCIIGRDGQEIESVCGAALLRLMDDEERHASAAYPPPRH